MAFRPFGPRGDGFRPRFPPGPRGGPPRGPPPSRGFGRNVRPPRGWSGPPRFHSGRGMPTRGPFPRGPAPGGIRPLMDEETPKIKEEAPSQGAVDVKPTKKEEPTDTKSFSEDVIPLEPKSEAARAKVTLDEYNCDLHFEVEGNGLIGSTLHKNGFEFIWGGGKATHGVKSGRVAFEVEVLEALPVNMPPSETTPHVLRVGWSVDTSGFPLGEEDLSYGYGGTAKSSLKSRFTDYGKPYGVGDVITCYADLESKPKAIFFTVNGEYQGIAFKIGQEIDGKALFPHIYGKNMKFAVNFGEAWPKFPLTSGFSMLNSIPADKLVKGPKAPKKEDAEIVMMVGLPAAGKTVWAEEHAKKNPDKQYYILGTNNIIDKMKVMGLARKRNYHGRWDELIKQATACLNVWLKIAERRVRNYILDQTNVYFSARRRKMRSFQGYRRIAAVIVNDNTVLTERTRKREREEGKMVPESAVMEMKSNFSLPEVGESFEEVVYIEEKLPRAKEIVEQFKKEGLEFKNRNPVQSENHGMADMAKRPRMDNPPQKDNPPFYGGPGARGSRGGPPRGAPPMRGGGAQFSQGYPHPRTELSAPDYNRQDPMEPRGQGRWSSDGKQPFKSDGRYEDHKPSVGVGRFQPYSMGNDSGRPDLSYPTARNDYERQDQRPPTYGAPPIKSEPYDDGYGYSRSKPEDNSHQWGSNQRDQGSSWNNPPHVKYEDSGFRGSHQDSHRNYPDGDHKPWSGKRENVGGNQDFSRSTGPPESRPYSSDYGYQSGQFKQEYDNSTQGSFDNQRYGQQSYAQDSYNTGYGSKGADSYQNYPPSKGTDYYSQPGKQARPEDKYQPQYSQQGYDSSYGQPNDYRQGQWSYDQSAKKESYGATLSAPRSQNEYYQSGPGTRYEGTDGSRSHQGYGQSVSSQGSSQWQYGSQQSLAVSNQNPPYSNTPSAGPTYTQGGQGQPYGGHGYGQ